MAKKSFSEHMTVMRDKSFCSNIALEDPLTMPRPESRTALPFSMGHYSFFQPQIPAVRKEPQISAKDSVITNQAWDTNIVHSSTGPTIPRQQTSRILRKQQMRKAKLITQPTRQVLIQGFMHWSEPLPKDLQYEDIIKSYPNHLWGPLLLEIAATWTPKEISETSGQPELKPNTLVKRIRAAKLLRDGQLDKLKPSKKPHGRASATTIEPKQTQALETFAESEASLQFRNEQKELQDIIMERDPSWTDRHANGRGRKKSKLDRELVARAVLERQRRIELKQNQV